MPRRTLLVLGCLLLAVRALPAQDAKAPATTAACLSTVKSLLALPQSSKPLVLAAWDVQRLAKYRELGIMTDAQREADFKNRQRVAIGLIYSPPPCKYLSGDENCYAPDARDRAAFSAAMNAVTSAINRQLPTPKDKLEAEIAEHNAMKILQDAKDMTEQCLARDAAPKTLESFQLAFAERDWKEIAATLGQVDRRLVNPVKQDSSWMYAREQEIRAAARVVGFDINNMNRVPDSLDVQARKATTALVMAYDLYQRYPAQTELVLMIGGLARDAAMLDARRGSADGVRAALGRPIGIDITLARTTPYVSTTLDLLKRIPLLISDRDSLLAECDIKDKATMAWQEQRLIAAIAKESAADQALARRDAAAAAGLYAEARDGFAEIMTLKTPGHVDEPGITHTAISTADSKWGSTVLIAISTLERLDRAVALAFAKGSFDFARDRYIKSPPEPAWSTTPRSLQPRVQWEKTAQEIGEAIRRLSAPR